MNLMADPGALHEHGGFLGGVGEAGELHGERGLLCERDQELTLLNVLGVALESEDQETHAARAEHQRVDHGTDRALAAVEGEHARPDVAVHTPDVEIERVDSDIW